MLLDVNDVDVDAMAKATSVARFRNNGQVCIAPQRFYVHKKIYAEFAAKLTQYVSRLKVGYGNEEGVQIGPLITRKQRDSVFALLEKAKTESLTKAELARRIGRRPEIVTRLLGSPGNWRLETVSDLLLGIGAEELDMSATSLLNRSLRNYSHESWVAESQKSVGQVEYAGITGANLSTHGEDYNALPNNDNARLGALQ